MCNFTHPCSTYSKVDAAPASPTLHFLIEIHINRCTHSQKKLAKTKAQTWNSKLHCKLFTSAVTILEMCVKRGLE